MGYLSTTARAAVKNAQASAQSRRRALPRLVVGPRDGEPTVYYLLPGSDHPQGGIRVGYRHVDELNSLGWQAAVLHRHVRDTASWFEHTTRVVDVASASLKEDDVLVVPEWYGPSVATIDPRLRTIIFNQGAYITYDGVPLDAGGRDEPYARVPRLESIMTVSEDSARLLRWGFPSTKIDLVRPVIDASVFFPGEAQRAPVLAYTPSRRPADLHQLLHLLQACGIDWELAPIAGMSEHAVADTLRRSAIFLSLSERDGFGLPPAEAMACGAYVIGFTGGGGDEFFDRDYSHPVASIAEFVDAVREAVATPLDVLALRGKAASAAILARYGLAGLRADLERVYRPVLGSPVRS